MFDLSGKVAIVTGGSRGLGRAMAVGFAEAGADVVVASRKLESCELAGKEIEAIGQRALPVACHMGKPDDVQRLVDTAYSELGHVDIVVNNAGASPGAMLVDTTPELWEKTYAVNTLGPILLASRCAERMREQGGGVIINVTTGGAFRPHAGLGLYCSSKAALHMLTMAMATEWAAWGVRVNEISPGPFTTDMMGPTLADPSATAAIAGQVLQQRIAQPEEIVGTALYLASDASKYATGSTVFIDGGFHV